MKTSNLNPKELAVLRACSEGPTTLDEMSRRFRRAKLEGQANSWARNSVRKPLRLGLLQHTGPGTYQTTALGLALLGLDTKPFLAAGPRIGPKRAESKAVADTKTRPATGVRR